MNTGQLSWGPDLTQHVGGRGSISNRSDNPKWANKKLFTTGEAAEICKVSQQTIIRAFDSGKLRGFRVPGSRFRRILRDELVRYMKASHISTDSLEGKTRRILIVDDDGQVNRAICNDLSALGPFEIEVVSNGYDAGVLTEQFKPHLIVLDESLPDIDVRLVCDRLRAHPDLADTKVVVLSHGDLQPTSTRPSGDHGVACVVQKPVNIAQLVQRVRDLLPI